jgi:hypothetical protein
MPVTFSLLNLMKKPASVTGIKLDYTQSFENAIGKQLA